MDALHPHGGVLEVGRAQIVRAEGVCGRREGEERGGGGEAGVGGEACEHGVCWGRSAVVADLGHEPELGHQSEIVTVGPVLDELVLGEPEDVDVLDRDAAARRRHAHERAGVVPGHREPGDDFVVLGDDVFDRKVQVGERVAKPRDRLPHAFGPARPVTSGFVVEELGVDELLGRVHLAAVEQRVERLDDALLGRQCGARIGGGIGHRAPCGIDRAGRHASSVVRVPGRYGEHPRLGRVIVVLCEREAELALLEGLCRDARNGHGRIAVLEGAAGIGKTALLSEARERAVAAGVAVLAGRGDELERDFPFGVTRQLLERPLAVLAPRERGDVLSGSASLVAPLLTGADVGPLAVADDDYAVLHGLYWACANFAQQQPLGLFVDDAHWADERSLRFLHFLARRLEGLPILLVIAVRTLEPGVPVALLERICREPDVTVLRPRPLGLAAVTAAIAAAVAAPEPAFAEACHRASGGNPFLLNELLRSLAEARVAPTAAEADRVENVGPDAVARSIIIRLERLGCDATALARAAAVLGDGVELRDAAAVAQLTPATADAAADSLDEAGLLAGCRPLRFVHPVVRAAIRETLSAAARANTHRRAVEVLAAAGAAPERLAAHLLATEPGTTPSAVSILREAARRASRQGAPEVAAAHLERALREELSSQERAALLLELARSEIDVGRPEALTHLRAAHSLTTDPRVRFEAASTLALNGDPADPSHALGLLDDTIAGLAGTDYGDLVSRLQADRLTVVVSSPTLDPAEAERLDALEAPEHATVLADSLTLLALARYRSMRGRPAAEVVPLAERAVASDTAIDALLRERLWLVNALVILLLGDRLDAAERVLSRALATARAAGSGPLFAMASTFSAAASLQRGAVEDAEADARAAIAIDGIGLWQHAAALASLVEALIERGRADEAERELIDARLDAALPDARPYTPLLIARGRLRSIAGRPDAALDDLLEAERRLERSGAGHAVGLDGRAEATLALLATGRRDEACRRADDDLDRAHRWGTPRVLARALRVQALAAGGSQTLPKLEQAAAALQHSPARLEYSRALLDLGGALRRANRRADARAPLRRALTLAEECGSVLLADATRRELAVTGVRVPRREHSGANSLTPSERRICDLAAQGRSNPQIAQGLFITVKTVEMHLGHAYRKLDISARDQLATALQPET